MNSFFPLLLHLVFKTSFLSKGSNPYCFENNMVNVAQLVRASDCGSEGRGFEPHLSPLFLLLQGERPLFTFS